MKLKKIVTWVCQACLDGEGKMCHTPGCVLFLHTVDLPWTPELYEVIAERNEDDELLALEIKQEINELYKVIEERRAALLALIEEGKGV